MSVRLQASASPFPAARPRAQLIQELHSQGLQAAQQLISSEAGLLSILQRMDAERGYLDFKETSLMAYATHQLKLPEATALNLINVARKAVQVPELKREIEAGELSVCVARKIVPVLTPQTQRDWIEKAKTLTTRALEKEVARVRPQEATPERYKYVTEDRIALSLGLDERSFQALKRVQDLESQRLKRAVSIEETIQAMTALYLERRDPVAQAERAQARAHARHQRAATTEAPIAPTTPQQPKRSDVTRQTPAPLSPASSSQKAREQEWDVTRQAPISGPGARSAPSSSIASARPSFPRPRQARRRPLPAALLRQVRLRDRGQCTHRDMLGLRCAQRRWLDTHHIVPVDQGGRDELDNLATLCSSHHRALHLGHSGHSNVAMRKTPI
jgi:hypothetical protein